MYFLTDEEKMDVNGVINESQIDKFKEVCLFRYKNGNMIFKTGPAYVFVLNTGLRAGEMLGLRWDDISFKKRTVSINRQVLTVSSDNDKGAKHEAVVIDSLKSDSGKRTLYLNDVAIECLKLLAQNTKNVSGYVLPGKQYEYMTYSAFRSTFDRIAIRAGIKQPGLGPHTLRHTFASYLFAQDMEVKYISEILGHSSVEITYKTYIHLIDSKRYENMKKIVNI